MPDGFSPCARHRACWEPASRRRPGPRREAEAATQDTHHLTMRSLPQRVLQLFSCLSLAAACVDKGPAGTTQSDTQESAASTSGLTPTSTGGSTENTASSTGTEPHETACVSWYDAHKDAYQHLCECDVSQGIYPSLAECLADAVGDPDCPCQLIDAAPETSAVLDCNTKAEAGLAACLKPLGLCPEDSDRQACFEAWLQAVTTCGEAPQPLCDSLYATCDEAGPLGQCIPP